MRVDVLDAGPHDLDRAFSDPTDRLEASAHHWTLATASPVRIEAYETVADLSSGKPSAAAVALVARPGPLVAMKLKASVDRLTAKEATDLSDVIRLVLDVKQHAARQFMAQRLRTRRILTTTGVAESDDVTLDAVAAYIDTLAVRTSGQSA